MQNVSEFFPTTHRTTCCSIFRVSHKCPMAHAKNISVFLHNTTYTVCSRKYAWIWCAKLWAQSPLNCPRIRLLRLPPHSSVYPPFHHAYKKITLSEFLVTLNNPTFQQWLSLPRTWVSNLFLRITYSCNGFNLENFSPMFDNTPSQLTIYSNLPHEVSCKSPKFLLRYKHLPTPDSSPPPPFFPPN